MDERNPRHERNEREIRNLLREVLHNGRASISKWLLIEVYGKDAFSLNIRRDLRQRWSALMEEWQRGTRPILLIAELFGSIVLMRSDIFYNDEEYLGKELSRRLSGTEFASSSNDMVADSLSTPVRQEETVVNLT